MVVSAEYKLLIRLFSHVYSIFYFLFLFFFHIPYSLFHIFTKADWVASKSLKVRHLLVRGNEIKYFRYAGKFFRLTLQINLKVGPDLFKNLVAIIKKLQ